MSNWFNISTILNSGNIPFKPEHWEGLSNRLDKIQLQDEKIREKLNNNPNLKASEAIWENIAKKIDSKSFTSTDYKIREILNGASKAYQRKHWFAFLALFYANKVWLKKWTIAAVGMGITFITVGVWNIFNDTKTNNDNNLSKNSIYQNNEFETNRKDVKVDKKISSNSHKNSTNSFSKAKNSTTNNSTILVQNNSKQIAKRYSTAPKKNTNSSNLIQGNSVVSQQTTKTEIDQIITNEIVEIENFNSELNYDLFLTTQEKYPNTFTKVEGIYTKILGSITFNNYPIKINVDYEASKESEAKYHIGYLNILNPFQNAHLPGLMGENYLQVQSSIHWQRILVDNLFSNFEFLYPLNNNLIYQHKINNNWGFGVQYQNKLTQNWLGQIAGVALSYNKDIAGGNLRLGIGNNLHQEQIIAKNLSFREQLALTNEINFTEVRNGKLKPLQKNSMNFSVGYFHDKFFIQLMQWEKVVWISNAIKSDYTYQKLEAGYNLNEYKNFRSTVFGGIFNDIERNYYAGASVAYKNSIALNALVMPYNYTEFSLIAKYKNIRSSVFWRSDLLNQSYAISSQSIYTGSAGLNVFWIW
jgi:hypothetical protein